MALLPPPCWGSGVVASASRACGQRRRINTTSTTPHSTPAAKLPSAHPGLGTGVANQQYTALTRHHGKQTAPMAHQRQHAPEHTTRPDQPCASIHFPALQRWGLQNNLASPIRICLIEGPARGLNINRPIFALREPQIHTKLPGKAEREGQPHTKAPA